jgi:hypothetical protein
MKFTQEMKEKILIMNKERKNNFEMAKELGIAEVTLSLWKRLMKAEGLVFAVPLKRGRPRNDTIFFERWNVGAMTLKTRRNRNKFLINKYGVELSECEKKFEEQFGLCLFCLERKRLFVKMDNQGNLVGLVCIRCL